MNIFNKDLDDIGFNTYEVSHELLKPYIYNFWSIKNDITFEKTNKILSDGSLGFIINFSNPYKITLNSQTITCNGRITLTGQTKHPSFMLFEKKLDAIGIRFKAGGAYIFFEEEVKSFYDKNINYDKYWNLQNLYQELVKQDTNREKIKLIEEFLIYRLSQVKKRNSKYTFDIVNFIKNRKGDVTVSEISEHFSLSSRQIERVFNKELGLSVKLYSRIIRMRNVRDLLSSLQIKNLTTTSYENGFFDQAHFIKEFRYFMNETPNSYYQNKLSMAKKFQYKNIEE